MKTMQRISALVMVVVLFMAALPVSAASVPPEKITGNPSCTSLGYAYGYKIDPPTSGNYNMGVYGAFNFTNYGTTMDWTSTGVVYGVIVKGGPNANLYRYVNGSFGDTNLTTPSDCGGGSKPCGISHVEVCFNYAAVETGDAPDSTNHQGLAMTAYFDNYGDPLTDGNFPTVSDSTLGTPVGMCHYVAPTGSYLGAGRSAEKDADLFADPDMSVVFGNVTNLFFLESRGVDNAFANLDSDDGLVLPPFWFNGVPALITYTVTVPNIGAVGNRYVNVWFDWDRDGDWGEAGVDCGGFTADEHTVANHLVTVAPGSTEEFVRTIIPCNNPNAFTNKSAVWVRITLSETPVNEITQADGSGKGTCYAEGETEDWFFEPKDPTAVELARFEAVAQNDGILIEWETATELDNLGFNLYRSTAANGEYMLLNGALIPTQVPGATFGATYTWLDDSAVPGVTYFYTLEDVNTEGQATLHGPIQATALSTGPSAVSLTAFSAGGGSGLWLPLALSAMALLGGLRRRK